LSVTWYVGRDDRLDDGPGDSGLGVENMSIGRNPDPGGEAGTEALAGVAPLAEAEYPGRLDSAPATPGAPDDPLPPASRP
jgi:hypothetical protein